VYHKTDFAPYCAVANTAAWPVFVPAALMLLQSSVDAFYSQSRQCSIVLGSQALLALMAHMAEPIVSLAAKLYKEDCIASTASIEVQIDAVGKSSSTLFTIQAIPMQQHVILQYQGLHWKLPRSDIRAWEQTSAFIFKALRTSIEQQFVVYDPDRRRYDINPDLGEVEAGLMSVSVVVGEKVVSDLQCLGWKRLQEEFNMSVMSMQYMTAAV
jgi:hypothetical protein